MNTLADKMVRFAREHGAVAFVNADGSVTVVCEVDGESKVRTMAQLKRWLGY